MEITNILEMSFLWNVTPGKMSQFINPIMTAGECSLSWRPGRPYAHTPC